jgi:hypothetical protein
MGLVDAYDAADVCRTLPRWIAEDEKEELTRGVPSAQFWTQVQGVLAADCILGCSPLVAPSAFARAYRNWGTLEG